ncbi:helix-turn-helix domain-containing protein [Methylobacillus caricis]|uniref:helix-turn-helix domain-containing protein n=1 Tax=Methylobacillus caricis TaxID=1971611 RepID=UPI001CFFCB39|nr:helix-turn-helix transcriptional regulator [Methylobacillus caricis]MCB5187392.1 helix-turn-helix domain-containing protein [Methylobacillus caricis]
MLRVASYATTTENAGMKIGSVIEKLRIEREWSQDELADKAGTTKSNLSRIENNSQWPRPELLEKIAAALDMKVYQIFALAESVSLPTAPSPYSKDEETLVKAYKAMEPDAQAHYLGLAHMIAKSKLN